MEAPVAHISQEDAVAKIQALLQAKRTRVRKGPAWPDANATVPGPDTALHPSLSGAEGDATDGRVLAPQRGDQSKRKG